MLFLACSSWFVSCWLVCIVCCSLLFTVAIVCYMLLGIPRVLSFDGVVVCVMVGCCSLFGVECWLLVVIVFVVVCGLLCGGVLFSVVVSWLRCGVRCGGLLCVVCCVLFVCCRFFVDVCCVLRGGSSVCCLRCVCWCTVVCVA